MDKAEKFFNDYLVERYDIHYTVDTDEQYGVTTAILDGIMNVKIDHDTREMTVEFLFKTMTACIEDTTHIIELMKLIQELNKEWHWVVMFGDEEQT